jgi:hypothetical protein
MAKAILYPDQIKYIFDHFLKKGNADIAEAIGVGESVVLRFKKRNNLVVPYLVSRGFATEKARKRTSCTPEQDIYIKKNFLSIPPQRIADMLGCSEQKVKTRMRQLGLTVPPEIIAQRVAASRIQSGNVPINKGKKQSDYMPEESIARTKATRFKKGNLPHNAYNEVGKITVRHDHVNRTDRPYQYICLSLGVWMPLHTHIWEQEFGKVGKGYCLWFKDGNSLNCVLDNLERITRAENARRNVNHDNPSDNRVAFYMATKSRKVDAALQKEILKHPELISAKRTQLLINRKIKNHGQKQNR